MNIIEKSSNGISQVSADAKLMSNRKVFIEGEINAESACEFVKKIMILNMQDSSRSIDLLINTPGGCINITMLFRRVRRLFVHFVLAEPILWGQFYLLVVIVDIYFPTEK